MRVHPRWSLALCFALVLLCSSRVSAEEAADATNEEPAAEEGTTPPVSPEEDAAQAPVSSEPPAEVAPARSLEEVRDHDDVLKAALKDPAATCAVMSADPRYAGSCMRAFISYACPSSCGNTNVTAESYMKDADDIVQELYNMTCPSPDLLAACDDPAIRFFCPESCDGKSGMNMTALMAKSESEPSSLQMKFFDPQSNCTSWITHGYVSNLPDPPGCALYTDLPIYWPTWGKFVKLSYCIGKSVKLAGLCESCDGPCKMPEAELMIEQCYPSADPTFPDIMIVGTCPTTTTTTMTTTTTTTVRVVTTTSSAEVEAGSSTIPLTDITGIEIGDRITISDGSNSETRFVVQILSTGRRLTADGRRLQSGSVVVNQPFVNSYSSGASVTSMAGPQSASVGSDPVVWFGEESKEFWLPVGKLTPVIHTRHLNMLASSFVGSPREQWIDRIVITNSDGFRFADIRIKKNLASFNRSEVPPNGFESMEVTLGMAHSPLKEMPKVPRAGSDSGYQRMGVSVRFQPLSKVFNWLPWHVDQTYIGRARREAVVLTSSDARFLIISSPATEYSGDFSYLSVEYAHLDIHVLDMERKQSVRGLLPELWGIQKTSNRTLELTCPPWLDKCAGTDHHAVDVDAEWNRRYFQV